MSQAQALVDTFQKIQQFKINPDKIHIEDPIFRLFSKVSVGCLVLCAGIVTMQQLIGEHIRCILPPKEDVRHEALNQYCFIMSTYTLPHLYNKSVGDEVPHYGVGPHTSDDEQKYHYYYQWVPFALFFQALSFMIPHFLWKSFEEGRTKAYCNLEVAPEIPMKKRGFIKQDEVDKKEKVINRAAVCFVGNLSYNKSPAIFYILCEVLNLFMVLLNFYLTNKFLGSNAFKNYGPNVLSYLRQDVNDADSDLNPMNQMFPKVAKCDFHKYGPSGNLIRYDILCVLALNIINEKIYMFLWFWFVILSVIGGLQLIYRVVMMFIPRLRFGLLQRRVTRKHKQALSDVLQKTGYADWFVLKLLSDNIDSLRFGELCDHIRTVFERQSPNGRISVSSTPSYGKHHSGSDDDAFITKPLV